MTEQNRGTSAAYQPVRNPSPAGYPPFRTPAYARVVRRVARTQRHGCHPIRPGDVYLEWTDFPGSDVGYADHAGHPVRMAECADCATRYGRAELL